MFTQAIPGGRRRTLDRNKKQLFCDAVARGATMTEAAVALGVSLRTVQREARRDAHFDQELRAVHNHPDADPLTVMKSHARRHWRATAWLLERQRPEEFARRPASSCSPLRFDQALRTVLEAALEVAPAALRGEVYQHVHAACERAFGEVFPTYGAFGRPRPPAPVPTPLADAEKLTLLRAGHGPHVPDQVEPVSLKSTSPQEPEALARARTAPQPVSASAKRPSKVSGPLEGREPEISNEESVVAQEPEALARASTALQPAPQSAKGSKASTRLTPDRHPLRLSHRYPLRVAATANQLDPRSLARAQADTLLETCMSLLSPPTQHDTTGDNSPPPPPPFNYVE